MDNCFINIFIVLISPNISTNHRYTYVPSLLNLLSIPPI